MEIWRSPSLRMVAANTSVGPGRAISAGRYVPTEICSFSGAELCPPDCEFCGAKFRAVHCIGLPNVVFLIVLVLLQSLLRLIVPFLVQ